MNFQAYMKSSLRMGEILGLTWDNVYIEDKNIAADNAYIFVDKN